MTSQLDTYQIETVMRKKAELEAQLRVSQAHYALAVHYQAELEEITAFLDAVQEVEAHGDGPHA